ncbi:M48 family metallopeptidase [Neorhizobium alkalisoli]|uniref:Zn-dependent protease with chaperone function n=1 Tax=Neorhizobium alkalisoli TaxID=528178 RepID=A0A561R1V8_9HYPH|nr:M48 family metallopeptidase [Neorhizobium alkalisoli]TWF56596.1 Zn-dependent protease with chaperone function [Neorhizobium alkalisoli]
MEFKISRVRHPKEKFYGSLMLVIGSLIWLIAVGAIVAAVMLAPEGIAIIFVVAFYIALLWFMSFVARALTRAYMIGHYVMVSEQQFPQLHKMVQDGARALGLKEAPQAFVYNSSGVMNAMALTLVGRTRYIWLTSQLIDADNEEQVKFVIGHELGHHVAGHLDTVPSLLHLPAYIVPFLGQAYSRGRELTCDRVGLVVSRNIQASRTALQMLACGSAKLNAQMNPTAFEAQERMVPSIAGFFLHIFSFYPRLTRRVEAISQFAQSANQSPAPQVREQAGRVEPQMA